MKKSEALAIKDLLFTQSPENIELAIQICRGLNFSELAFIRKHIPECYMFPMYMRKNRTQKGFSAFLDFEAFSILKIWKDFDLSHTPPLQSIKTVFINGCNVGENLKEMPFLPNLELIEAKNCPSLLSLEGMPFFPKLKEVAFLKSKITSLRGLPIIRELKIRGLNHLSGEKRAYRAYTTHCWNTTVFCKSLAGAKPIFEYPLRFWDKEHPLIKSGIGFYV